MSGDADPGDKTEEPTEKRLADAIERGQAAFSREAPVFASLFAALAVVALILPRQAQGLLEALIGVVDDPAGFRIGRGEDVLALMGPVAGAAASFLAPALAVLMAAGLVASAAQGAPRVIAERIVPDFSRISLKSGFRRVFGARGAVEFLKSLMKLGAVGTVAAIVLAGQKAVLLTAIATDPGTLPERILTLATKAIAALLIGGVCVAAGDIAWSRILWRRDNRMSRHELKEEIKQAEGDRLIKARLKSLRLDRSRKRMLAAVPRATMVVANPTHYAVAMRYMRGEGGGAPVVLAKGADLVALKIRAIAEAHDIPVIEDKPLARSLYSSVEVERPIPAEFYRAVAEIVHLIQQRKTGWPRKAQ